MCSLGLFCESFVLLNIQKQSSAGFQFGKCAEQVLVGGDGERTACSDAVECEFREIEAGTELVLQLGQRGEVTFDSSSAAIGPVLAGRDLAVIGGFDCVCGEGRHDSW